MTEPAAGAYTVRIDWTPVHEFLVSLHAFLHPQLHRILELGPGWAQEVRRSLPKGFQAELKDRPVYAWSMALLVLGSDPEARSGAEAFVTWLSALSAGDIYELLSPLARKGAPELLSPDLAGLRDHVAGILSTWNESYFKGLDQAILDGLADEAQTRSKELSETDLSPADYLTRLTSGVVLEQSPLGFGECILVPQYHFRPLNVLDAFQVAYPADVLPLDPGQPRPGLVRLTRALGDESRLRILRFLSSGPRSFSDVVAFSGLAKSTVYHHLIALRAAGLLRVHFTGGRTDLYSFRPRALEDLQAGLSEYLREPDGAGN